MKKILKFVVSLLHRKYDIGIKDKSGWGYRCGKCESEQGKTVWHKIFWG